MNGDVEGGMPPPDEPAEVQCPFCLIAEGKIETNIVYSDDRFIGILDINPANIGHVLLFPRFHCSSFTHMADDSVSRMFVVAKKICGILVETLQAKGFNIFLANGQVAGQNVPHVILHLIPRYDQDGVAFGWKPKQFSKEEMKNTSDLIKSFSVSDEAEIPDVYYDVDEDERIA